MSLDKRARTVPYHSASRLVFGLRGTPWTPHRRLYMKRFLTALVALALFATAAAQTLIVGQSGLPVTLDTGQDGNSLTPAIQVVERLVGFKQGSAEIDPLLEIGRAHV